MNKATFLIVGILYLLLLVALMVYLALSGNEYAWIHEIDATATLPEDNNLQIKKVLFGIPVFALMAAVLAYSFMYLGKAYKTIAILACIISLAILFN